MSEQGDLNPLFQQILNDSLSKMKNSGVTFRDLLALYAIHTRVHTPILAFKWADDFLEARKR